MRLVLATALVFFGGSAAFASSITLIGPEHAPGSSIIGITCETCNTVPRVRKSTYKVPELASPPQKTDIVDINGEKKLVRTEAWFGGSPVIHVSKLPAWMSEEKAIASLHPAGNGSTERDIAATTANEDGVDLSATTSAVDAVNKAEAAPLPPVEPRPLALDDFHLRAR